MLGTIAYFAGFNILKFIRYIKEELLIVLGTSSSESVLPRMMNKLENLGCNELVVGLVIPSAAPTENHIRAYQSCSPDRIAQ